MIIMKLSHNEMLEYFPLKYRINPKDCSITEGFIGMFECPVKATLSYTYKSASRSFLQVFQELKTTSQLKWYTRWYTTAEHVYKALLEIDAEHNELVTGLHFVKADTSKVYQLNCPMVPKQGDVLYMTVTSNGYIPMGVYEVAIDAPPVLSPLDNTGDKLSVSTNGHIADGTPVRIWSDRDNKCQGFLVNIEHATIFTNKEDAVKSFVDFAKALYNDPINIVSAKV